MSNTNTNFKSDGSNVAVYSVLHVPRRQQRTTRDANVRAYLPVRPACIGISNSDSNNHRTSNSTALKSSLRPSQPPPRNAFEQPRLSRWRNWAYLANSKKLEKFACIAKIMVITFFLATTNALAQDPYYGWYTEAGGASGTTYTITTPLQLTGMAQIIHGNAAGVGIAVDNFAGKTINLGADISLESSTNWTPIGFSYYLAFQGTFNGNGHKITNLQITSYSYTGAGLFGNVINGGRVHNLGVENVSINASSTTGAIAGLVENGTIENCYVVGGSVSGTMDVGAVAGRVDHSVIRNCYATVPVTATTGDNSGGIVGTNVQSSVINCAALNPSVTTGTGTSIGRIAGYSAVTGATYTDNVAFNEMTLTIAGASYTPTPGATNKDGSNVTKVQIFNGTAFNNLNFDTDIWTRQEGRLPGLRGLTVELPAYLMPPGLVVNGSLYTSVATARDAINDALLSGDVTVTGNFTATATMIITIPNGRTLTWNAVYERTAYETYNLLVVQQHATQGSGKFILGENGILRNTDRVGHALRVENDITAEIYGTIEYTGPSTAYTAYPLSLVGNASVTTKNGSIISNRNTSSLVGSIYCEGSSSLFIEGGTIGSSTSSRAIEAIGTSNRSNIVMTGGTVRGLYVAENSTSRIYGGTISVSGAIAITISGASCVVGIYGGIIEAGSNNIVSVTNRGTLYVSGNGGGIADGGIYTSSSTADWARGSAYFSGSNLSKFRIDGSAQAFNAPGASQTLFDLNHTLTQGTASGAPYVYSAETPHTGAVVASFPASVDNITDIVVNGLDADRYTVAADKRTVVFEGKYLATDVTFTVEAPLLNGRLPAGFETAAFNLNIQRQDDADISAVLPLVAGATYTAAQANVSNIAQARSAVTAIIETLALNGVTATVNDTGADAFVAAIDGATENQPNGVDGTYKFTVELAKGAGTTQTTNELTLNIVATYFMPQVFFSVVGGNGGISAFDENNVVFVENGAKITYGNDIFFSAGADPGYQVKEWTVNGVVQTSQEEYIKIENITEETTVTVEFERITYDAEAIALVKALIDNNDLYATPDEPGTWDFAKWDENTNPRQLIELHLDGSLDGGAVSFTVLNSLKFLDVSNNALTSLDVSGLANLETLHCSNNYLTALDLSALDKLDEFVGAPQVTGLILIKNAHDVNYSVEIDLLNPTFFDEHGTEVPASIIAYANGVLTSADKTLQGVGFTVDVGNDKFVGMDGLFGEMYLIYFDAPPVPYTELTYTQVNDFPHIGSIDQVVDVEDIIGMILPVSALIFDTQPGKTYQITVTSLGDAFEDDGGLIVLSTLTGDLYVDVIEFGFLDYPNNTVAEAFVQAPGSSLRVLIDGLAFDAEYTISVTEVDLIAWDDPALYPLTNTAETISGALTQRVYWDVLSDNFTGAGFSFATIEGEIYKITAKFEVENAADLYFGMSAFTVENYTGDFLADILVFGNNYDNGVSEITVEMNVEADGDILRILLENVTNIDAVITYSVTIEGEFPQYELSVIGGVIAGGATTGEFNAGATVSIVATVPANHTFVNWTSAPADVVFANANSATTSFVMPAGDVVIEANFAPIVYFVNVENGVLSDGSGSGEYEEGATVVIVATVPQGQQFVNWTVQTPHATSLLDDATSAETSFVMPAGAITVTANFAPIQSTTYEVTVIGGSGSGNFAAGATVVIVATVPQGQQFVNWTVQTPHATSLLADATNATTSFVMPASAVTVTANFAAIQQPTTNVPELTLANPLRAWMRNGLLHIEGITVDAPLSIFSATGVLVYNGIATSEEMDIPLRAEGVYIIRSGGNVVRVVVN